MADKGVSLTACSFSFGWKGNVLPATYNDVSCYLKLQGDNQVENYIVVSNALVNRFKLLLVVMASAAFVCQGALAAPITLICNNGLRDDQQPHITIDLDEAKSTTTVNYPATSIDYSSHGIPNPVVTPAHSTGPLMAAFNSKTIRFDLHDNSEGSYYTLDRMTGVLLYYISANGVPFDQASPQDRGIWTYNCEVGNAKF
jgi:hypothetical protein